jgi:hypothetical protein
MCIFTNSFDLSCQTCAKIFPKLERLVLHTPQAYFYLQHPHLEPRFTFPNNFRDAIAEYRFEGPSVPSFEIDCDRIIYKPHKDEKTGTFTYIS